MTRTGDDDERTAQSLARAALAGEAMPAHTSAVGRSTLEGGVPLDAGTRADMEQRFSHPFADVRVHTANEARQLAEAAGASAFTFGRDIVFGEGMFAPHTQAGRRLLAHELGHVVTQRRGDVIHRQDKEKKKKDEQSGEKVAQTPPDEYSAPPGTLVLQAAPGLRPLVIQVPEFDKPRPGDTGVNRGTPQHVPGPQLQEIDWSANSKARGLAAEDTAWKNEYADKPGAQRPPPNYYGFDFWVGGIQTPLAGMPTEFRGKKDTVTEGVHALGGTGISYKTLDNRAAMYQSEKEFKATIDSFIADAAWSLSGNDKVSLQGPGADGKGVNRFEGEKPTRREVRIVTPTALSPEQKRWLDEKITEAKTKFVTPDQSRKDAVNAPVHITHERHVPSAPPPSNVAGARSGQQGVETIPSRPPLSLPADRGAKVEAVGIGGLVVYDLIAGLIGGKIQSAAADAAFKAKQPEIQAMMDRDPTQGITVFLRFKSSPDRTGESVIHPIPTFTGDITMVYGKGARDPVEATDPEVHEQISFQRVWIPPTKKPDHVEWYKVRNRANYAAKILRLCAKRMGEYESGTLVEWLAKKFVRQGQLDSAKIRAQLEAAQKNLNASHEKYEAEEYDEADKLLDEVWKTLEPAGAAIYIYRGIE